MLIAGGSSVAGSDNPHDGTSMPLGAVHPICRSYRESGAGDRSGASPRRTATA
jgi:hypothetical protein